MAYQDFAGKRRPSSGAYPEKTSGYVTVDDPTTGTGKMDVETIFNNFAGKFDPARSAENPYLPNQWVVKDGSLYRCKNSHYGIWDSANFERKDIYSLFCDGLFATSVLPSDVIEKRWVNSNGTLTYDVNFDTFVYAVKPGDYISFTAAPGSGYMEFTDEDFNLVGSVFTQGNSYTLVNYMFYEVPEGASYIRITSTNRTPYKPTLVVYKDGNADIDLYEKINETKKLLSGKNLLIIGDSLTEQNKYTQSLIDDYGCYIYNRGASGTTVAMRSGHSLSFCERFDLAENNNPGPNTQGFPNRSLIDAVVVWGGINDWGGSVPIGSIEGVVDKETFFGAYKYLIEGLKTRYYGKPIIVCSVHNSARSTVFLNWNRATFNGDGSFTFRTNSQNKYLSDYWDAQKQICDIFGVRFVNMFDCGVSFMSQYDLDHYSLTQGTPPVPDGLHLNNDGGKIVARYLSSIIANALA